MSQPASRSAGLTRSIHDRVLGGVMVGKPSIGYQFIGIVFVLNGIVDIGALLLLRSRLKTVAEEL